jgi:HlyD family secretion protein
MSAIPKSLWAGKRTVALSVLALLVAGGIVFWVLRGRAAAVEYITAPVERGSIRNVVNATGTVQALLTVLVGSQVSAQVESLHADFNSIVKRGQILAKLDARRYQAAVIAAQANLQAARARVQSSEADLNSALANRASSQANLEAARVASANAAQILARYEQLREDGILSQNDYDTARTNAESGAARHEQAKAQLDQVEAQIHSARAQVEQLKAQVEQAEASLRQAQVDLDYTTITSPVDGVVISRDVDVGQTVAASLSAPTLFVIANDLTKMQVNASLDEADIGNISSVEEVQFTVDAYPNRSYLGRISEVRLQPSTEQNVTTYSVIIDVENERLELKPGMTANITITVARQDDVLKIPNAAMRYLPPGTTREQVVEMTRSSGSDRVPAALAKEAEKTASGQASGGNLIVRRSEDRAANRPARTESPRPLGRLRDTGQSEPPPDGGQADLAPGQMWDPAGKIQFPQQQGWTARPSTVWVLGGQKKPEPRQVLLGITDGTATQVISGELQETDEVIVGDSTQAAAAQTPQQDRGPGGGGGFIFGRR